MPALLPFSLYLVELWFHRPWTCGCWADHLSVSALPSSVQNLPCVPVLLPQPILGILSRATFTNTNLIVCLASPLPLCFGLSKLPLRPSQAKPLGGLVLVYVTVPSPQRRGCMQRACSRSLQCPSVCSFLSFLHEKCPFQKEEDSGLGVVSP